MTFLILLILVSASMLTHLLHPYRQVYRYLSKIRSWAIRLSGHQRGGWAYLQEL